MKVALMRELKDYFIEQAGKIENTTVHGLKDEGSAPHIISLGIAGIEVRFFFIHWKIRGFMSHRDLHVHRIIRQ